MMDRRDTSHTGPRPGLRALVVYLRPAPRRRLLNLLIDAGMFVIEHEGAATALSTALGTRSDLVVVVGRAAPEDAELAGALLKALSSVLVAIVPPGTAGAGYLAAGAAHVIDEGLADAEIAARIGAAAGRARWLRELGERAAELLVFRDIRFRTLPPELVRGSRSVPLTRVETAVLLHLARSLTRPVQTGDLVRHLAGTSSRPEIHAAYLKTIVLRIRRKVEDLGGDPTMLRSVRGVGYMLVA